MIITSKIKMDLSVRSVTSRVNAVQDDKYSRNVEISLFDNFVAWEPPAGTAAIVRYRKSDGTGGNYDTLPDGTAAYSISGNVLTVALAPQVCTAPGRVKLAVGLICGDAEINTFSIDIDVQPNPGIDVVSEDYTNMRGGVPASGWTSNMYLGTDENGNVVTKEAPEGTGVTVTVIDLSNFENGTWTETVDGEIITHTVTFDASGRPITMDDIAIRWEASA